MSPAAEKLNELFARWKEEHRALDDHVAHLCNWFHRQGNILPPPYLEAAAKLGELRQQLEAHFIKELELGRLLAEAHGTVTIEIEGVRQKQDSEHTHLLQRLGQLIHLLGTADRGFEPWEAAVRDFELFVDVLEQHEEQEAASVEWLRV